MFRHQLIRLLSLIGVILISIGFISGIGSPTDMIQDSIENYYRDRNVSDFIIPRLVQHRNITAHPVILSISCSFLKT